METVWLAIWLGSVLACVVKMTSPHRKPMAWVVVALVGGVGGLAGLFVCRFVGIARDDVVATVAVADAISVVVVLVYAVLSRIMYAMQVRASARAVTRQTRPTIVF
ncbi:MAG: hypothetical protein ACXVEF_43790 [Polyangiales bacterium]